MEARGLAMHGSGSGDASGSGDGACDGSGEDSGSLLQRMGAEQGVELYVCDDGLLQGGVYGAWPARRCCCSAAWSLCVLCVTYSLLVRWDICDDRPAAGRRVRCVAC